MKKKITIIEETGAAGEVTAQAVKVLSAVAEQYDHYFEGSGIRLAETPPFFSENAAAAATGSDALLFSGTATEQAIKKTFPLVAMVQPVAVYPPLQHLSPLKPRHSEGMNLLIYQDQAAATDENSRLRIAQSAVQQAANRKKKISIVAEPESSSSWQQVFEKIGKTTTEIHLEQVPLQTAWDLLLQQPAEFDIIVTDAAAGYYLFSQAAAISGARLMIPSVRVTEAVPFFGPAFGFDQQNENNKSNANPVGAILSVAMMLDYFGLHEEALIIRTAINWTLLHGFVSKDIDAVNNYSTGTIGDLVSDFIRGTIPGFAKGENMALQKSTII
ncbi:isocitrate/isopropylmalate family dehydrogenase [Niabella beijingensis]|uniref:isocitrate/isopropylmalate family dehydrogenase n=1 Tax=Niabella beijingensis TaxID=2872700 RepID=UPI001CC07228|nr:isocitrate/isopropylmalate family dehydrogenase [Niabella beijingensis]MBZ4188276.1 3-isopropylmalate dehydrogenase [Niabella beijingensis]